MNFDFEAKGQIILISENITHGFDHSFFYLAFRERQTTFVVIVSILLLKKSTSKHINQNLI